jgi:hypothetical protein
MFLICTERRNDNLHIIAHAFRKEGTQGTIGQAAEEDGAFARSAFALEKAAGNLTGRIQPLFVVDGEWEKINAFARLLGRGGSDQDYGIAVADGHRPIRLSGQFPGLNGNFRITKRGRITLAVVHEETSKGLASEKSSGDKQGARQPLLGPYLL